MFLVEGFRLKIFGDLNTCVMISCKHVTWFLKVPSFNVITITFVYSLSFPMEVQYHAPHFKEGSASAIRT